MYLHDHSAADGVTTMDFLQLDGKAILVFGVANRKSVAYHVGQTLAEAGAIVHYVVRSGQRKESVAKLLDGAPIHVCDVERQEEIDRLQAELTAGKQRFAGVVHSIAFADYSDGNKP